MTIAEEIEARIHLLQDPAIRFVNHTPSSGREQCLLLVGSGRNHWATGEHYLPGLGRIFSDEAELFLMACFGTSWLGTWSDGHTQDEVLSKLKDCWRQAIDRGV
jgi:hypothetical protein